MWRCRQMTLMWYYYSSRTTNSQEKPPQKNLLQHPGYISAPSLKEMPMFFFIFNGERNSTDICSNEKSICCGFPHKKRFRSCNQALCFATSYTIALWLSSSLSKLKYIKLFLHNHTSKLTTNKHDYLCENVTKPLGFIKKRMGAVEFGLQ